MAEHTFTGSIDAPADEVWKVVREFGDGSWMGVDLTTENGEGVGSRRIVPLGPTRLVEECERLDDDARVLGYTVVEGEGMPFTDYHSTMTVEEEGAGTKLLWQATYEPVGDPGAASATLDAIYGGGFAGLKSHCES